MCPGCMSSRASKNCRSYLARRPRLARRTTSRHTLPAPQDKKRSRRPEAFVEASAHRRIRRFKLSINFCVPFCVIAVGGFRNPQLGNGWGISALYRGGEKNSENELIGRQLLSRWSQRVIGRDRAF